MTDVSWEAGEVNAAFNSLESPVNLQRKPLIRFPMDTWFFIDQHFCGMGFYHTAYELIKENLDTLDRLQGSVVENMLIDEIKKRLSVDEFDAIDDVSLLRSLGLGMVKAQKRCFGHERYLKKNSTMTLEGKDKSFSMALMEILLLHLWHRENPEQPSIRKSAIEMLEKSNPYAMYVG